MAATITPHWDISAASGASAWYQRRLRITGVDLRGIGQYEGAGSGTVASSVTGVYPVAEPGQAAEASPPPFDATGMEPDDARSDPLRLIVHPETGELWEVEHGPQGGDELNIVRPGRNYGWPVVSYGRAYTGEATVGTGGTGPELAEPCAPGMEQPLLYWYPVISPGGMALYTGDAFPAWKGSLFIGGMSTTQLQRIVLNQRGLPVRHIPLLTELNQRIRDVKQGPDGLLYVTTDHEAGAGAENRAGRKRSGELRTADAAPQGDRRSRRRRSPARYGGQNSMSSNAKVIIASIAEDAAETTVEALVDTTTCGWSCHRTWSTSSSCGTWGARTSPAPTVPREQRRLAGPVTVRIGDRSTATDCLVGPAGSQAVVGHVVLAMLDLVADEAGTLRPRDPDGPVLSLKTMTNET